MHRYKNMLWDMRSKIISPYSTGDLIPNSQLNPRQHKHRSTAYPVCRVSYGELQPQFSSAADHSRWEEPLQRPGSARDEMG